MVVALGIICAGLDTSAGTYARPTPFPTLSNPTSGNDASFAISKPHEDEQVSNGLMFVLGAVLPFLLLLGWAYFSYRCYLPTKALEWFHGATLVLCGSLALMMFLVVSLKHAAGRLRPDFAWRVDNNSDIEDGRKSWPSGHAGMSAQGMTCVTLQIAAQLKVFAAPGRHGSFAKLIASLAPQVLGLWISITCTQDRHNFDDVLAGYIIGMVSAVMVHLIIFHPLSNEECDMPRRREQPTQASSDAEEAAPTPSDVGEQNYQDSIGQSALEAPSDVADPKSDAVDPQSAKRSWCLSSVEGTPV